MQKKKVILNTRGNSVGNKTDISYKELFDAYVTILNITENKCWDIVLDIIMKLI